MNHMPDLNTERLFLRPICDDDWKNYISHVIAANEIYIQYGSEPTDDLIEYIQNPTPNVIYYSVIEENGRTMIGYIGIMEYNDNIEFYIFKEFRRNGYAAEALYAFIKAYLDGDITGSEHWEITAETLYENTPSVQLLEKLGFQREAIGFRICENKNDVFSGISLCEYKYERQKNSENRSVRNYKNTG